jgi:hypothetical protein
MRTTLRFLLALALSGLATGASAQTPEKVDATYEARMKADELARELANPVANLWSLTF